MSLQLKVHESTTAAGELSPVFLRFEDGVLAIRTTETTLPLPAGALEAVMARFGAPLEPAEPVTLVASLDLDEGRALRHVRHLARFDVIARDYLLYEAPQREPLCALAVTVTAALDHLARAASARA